MLLLFNVKTSNYFSCNLTAIRVKIEIEIKTRKVQRLLQS